MSSKKRTNKKRFSQEEWLEKALRALAKEGGSVLSVDALAKHLGVSRGSFYWHFKDKSDFVLQLVDYWIEVYTKSIIDYLEQMDISADKKLLLLMEKIVTERLTQYDISIRAWASHDPVASRKVKKNDELRYNFVRSLFSEIGFKGEELEMRTRTFVVYNSLETGLFYKLSKKKQFDQMKLRHIMLTRK